MAAVQLPLPAGLHEREPKQEPQNIDDQDETSTSNASMTSKFDESKGGGTNNSAATANPFLGMAAASLMDPSAAKGEDFYDFLGYFS